ncbi:hypothetical protein HMPREF1215_00633 [Coprococcus sp. HPP0074]|nr:hypothetical protein HMPREF1215_00633 [Coprococcus sp. HPP0074]
MSSYGKILDGRLTLQHGVVNYEGKNIINPSDEILRKLGWYPVKSDVQLPPKEGFMIIESYILVEEQVTDEGAIPSHILIKHAYEALPPVEPQPTLQDQIDGLKKRQEVSDNALQDLILNTMQL